MGGLDKRSLSLHDEGRESPAIYSRQARRTASKCSVGVA